MPDSTEDARKVQDHIDRIFEADPDDRTEAIRRLFVEVLDFHGAAGQISLVGAAKGAELPDFAERIASLDGVHVLWVALASKRVNKREAAEAARLIEKELGEDLLLVCTNRDEKLGDADQLHLILPDFESGTTPTLRRRTVERGLRQRTAFLEIAGIYSKAKGLPVRTAIRDAFEVEPVTKRFFAEYDRIFKAAKEIVTGFERERENGDTPEERHKAADEKRNLFVQTLFNRLMFVHFLSRKGWLTFNEDKNYLSAIWRDHKATAEEANFHRDRLRPLFFDGLSNPESQSRTYPDIGRVPFLNGGLFEETALDEREGVTVPNEAIEPLLDLFGTFNFTVMESTPFDVEVAVDPEMLGKVFEELVTGRHDSGSYYTPRPVVSFMCREALKGYLEGCETGLDAEAISAFVDEQRTEGIIDIAAARKVAEALSEVTVVDPACGSGAYLLGMMQELVELQTVLFNAGADRKSLHALKLEIIERNLHGVDNDGFAVNIAMLRLWLSLAIEDEPPVDPLPNLNFKIVCGDSLLGPDPSGLSLDRVTIEQSGLGRLKSEYLRESDGDQKERLRGEIEAAREQIRTNLGGTAAPEDVVDWRVEFAEVFASRGGFDIAIANPPYVRYQKIDRNLKAKLKRLYGTATVGQSDLYCHFYVRALQLLRLGGAHVFVCSNSWLDVAYGAKLQEYLLGNAHVEAIYESAVERQFSTADINTMISVIRKVGSGENAITRFVSLRGAFGTAVSNPDERVEIKKSRSLLAATGTLSGTYVGDKWGAKYLRAPSVYHHIMEACSDRLVRIGDMAEVRYGIITGANRFFYLDKEAEEEWKVEDRFLLPVLTTPREAPSLTISRDALPHKVFYCHEEKDALQGTRALSYIEWGESQEFHNMSACRPRKRWWDLGARVPAQLAVNTLIDSVARTFLSKQALLFDQTLYTIAPVSASAPSVCAAMNSTVTQMMINLGGRTNFGGGLLRLAAYEVASLAIPDPTLVPDPDAAIFTATNWDVINPSAARREIDEMVFDALGLTVGEQDAVYEAVIELVENRKLRARSLR